jgi:hypothetical protein
MLSSFPRILSRLTPSTTTRLLPTPRLIPTCRTLTAMATSTQLPQQMKAVQIQEQGDIDVLQVREVPVPTPGKGQVLYKVEWAG